MPPVSPTSGMRPYLVTVTMPYETLRRAAFDARVSQQALPTRPEKWCLEQRRNGDSTVAKLHATMEG